MKEPREQIQEWLKKLEQESWQLELLVSAFTIFLLLQAIGSFEGVLESIYYQYNVSDSFLSFLYLFLTLVNLSVKALTLFMVLHLLLRGFWIGAIGLRSVQSEIVFERLNYSKFFTEKIRKRVISLDDLVILLDEICSLIFSTAFLVISMILSFGLYLIFIGLFALIFSSIASIPGIFTVVAVIGFTLLLVINITGIIYFLDYFTLGFFKKFNWLSKAYYPVYRFYGAITFAVISRSIYYYLISRFSKKRIRYAYLGLGGFFLLTTLVSYDQYQFFPSLKDSNSVTSNYYDSKRGEGYIERASIQDHIISEGYIELFIRYNPQQNPAIRSNCEGFIPKKKDGFNWKFEIVSKEYSFYIRPQDYSEEDRKKLLSCLSSSYQVFIDDSLRTDLSYYFYTHPSKEQKGILSMIDVSQLSKGEHILKIETAAKSDEGMENEELALIPFWVN